MKHGQIFKAMVWAVRARKIVENWLEYYVADSINTKHDLRPCIWQFNGEMT